MDVWQESEKKSDKEPFRFTCRFCGALLDEAAICRNPKCPVFNEDVTGIYYNYDMETDEDLKTAEDESEGR